MSTSTVSDRFFQYWSDLRTTRTTHTTMRDALLEFYQHTTMRDALLEFFKGCNLDQGHEEKCCEALVKLCEANVYTCNGQEYCNEPRKLQKPYISGQFCIPSGTNWDDVVRMMTKIEGEENFLMESRVGAAMQVDQLLQSFTKGDGCRFDLYEYFDCWYRRSEQNTLTYVDGRPFTNVHLDLDEPMRDVDVGDAVLVVSFTVWSRSWEEPTSLLETRLLEAVENSKITLIHV